MFDQKAIPALNQLHTDLSGMRGSSDDLDHSVDALTAQVQSLGVQIVALQKSLVAANRLHAQELKRG